MPRPRVTNVYASTIHRIAQEAGECFGPVAAQVLYSTLDDFAAAVVRGDECACFVVAALHSRVCRTRRHRLPEVVSEWLLGRRGRWLMDVMRSAFGLYCLFRHRAVPRSAQPVLPEGVGGHFPRRLQRALRSRGVVGHTLSQRRTLHERACARLREVWDDMEGVN